MTRNVLFFNHTHTPDSNRFEEEVRNLSISTHATDYIELARALPAGQNAVFVKTDHWRTDPSYFDRLQSRIESLGGSFERFDVHVCFQLRGSTAVVINGVECSLNREQYHITIGGLPLSDDQVYRNINVTRLLEIGARSGWIAPAHIGLPFHQTPDSYLTGLFDRAMSSDTTAALGYPTGYFPLYNRLSRNDLPWRTSVSKYASRYGLPLMPELDLHGVVPKKFSGCGVLDSSVMPELRDGGFPVAEILDADVLRPAGDAPGVTLAQFLKDYAIFLPIIDEPEDPQRRFRRSIPDTTWLESFDVQKHTVSIQSSSGGS